MKLKLKELENMKTSELVDLYNKYSGAVKVTKFHDRSVAVKRCMDLELPDGAETKKVESEKASTKAKPKGEKAPNVYDAMKAFCKCNGGKTRDEVLDHVAVLFPKRTRASLGGAFYIGAKPKYGYEVFEEKEKPTRYKFKG